MKLLEFKWIRWRVLAVCDHRDTCQVLKYLVKKARSYKPAKRMLFRLRYDVPKDGPEFDNDEKVKHYDDGIYAFREQPSKGPKPRVYFFMDGDNVIVCTEAFLKRNENINGYIEYAKEVRDKYFDAKKKLKLRYEKLGD
jgi:putative component of toxin-antitoxin plasmid stabilization module